MKFISLVFDSGDLNHGLCIGAHADLYAMHGENCEIRIEALYYGQKRKWYQILRPGQIEEGEDVPPHPGVWHSHAFLFFDRQSGANGCTIGRTKELERFAGWVCRIEVDKLPFERLDRREVQDLCGYRV